MSPSKDQPFLLGLIGNPVEHSRSPQIFERFFSSEGYSHAQYHLFPLNSVHELNELISSQPALMGFNVTIPFKQDILSILHYISPEALSIGAVNTVKIIRNRESKTHELHGYNTDYFGFEASLKELPQKPQKAIVIGTGGSSKAVTAVLKAHEIPFSYVSRSMGLTLSETSYSKTLIVNCTPVGMHPKIDETPLVNLHSFDNTCTLIDLIYNPDQTLIMKQCQKNGIFAMNGKRMLQIQAEKAWSIFKS